MKKTDKMSAYVKAERRVKELRKFYNSLFVYLVFLILWILFAQKIIRLILTKVNGVDAGFINWLDINLWLTPAFWGFILLIYGLFVFTNKFNFIKKWEKEKIEEYMSDDVENNTTNWE